MKLLFTETFTNIVSNNEGYLFSVGGTGASLFNVKKCCAHLERGIRGQMCQTGDAALLSQLLLQSWVGSGRARLAEGFFGCSSSEHM